MKFESQEKDWKSSDQVREILQLDFKLVALILSLNCINGLRVPKLLGKLSLKEPGAIQK